MQAFDAVRFNEGLGTEFAEAGWYVAPASQQQPADSYDCRHEDNAEKPFLVCTVLTRAERELITESHVDTDPRVGNSIPGMPINGGLWLP